jgi:hypothetical protein
VIGSVRSLDDILHEGEFCHWPRAPLSPINRRPGNTTRATSDTTKVNMGRRRNPTCNAWMCSRRVEAKGDEFCRVCLAARTASA